MKLFGRKILSRRIKCCGNCDKPYDDPGDLYCRYCGAEAGRARFLPSENFNGCVYGPPPVIRKHTCRECGYTWETNRMIDRSAYCPKCGGAITTQEDGGPF